MAFRRIEMITVCRKGKRMIEPVSCRDCGSLPVFTFNEIKGTSFIEYDISHRCLATRFVHRGASGVDRESVIKEWNRQQQVKEVMPSETATSK